jgi:hypothetical protein
VKFNGFDAATTVRVVVLLALSCAAVAAQRGHSGRVETSVRLHATVFLEGLPSVGRANLQGLGAEAQRVEAWTAQGRPPFTLNASDRTLKDAADRTEHVTPEMAVVLRNLSSWYSLEAPKDNPITHDQLRAATLAARSIERIRGVFEESIARGIRVGGKWLTPEAGGEATVDTELRLIEATNPQWKMVQALAKASRDPRAVASLYERFGAEAGEIDRHDLIKLALARFQIGARGAALEVERAVLTVAENSAPTYVHEPLEQLEIVARTEWRGRYAGMWHTHAPHEGSGAWAAGDGPSVEDMQNAIAAGQYLTLAFQPDGFDLHDASPLSDAGKVDLTLVKVIRYRSPSWRAHFEALHRKKR